MYSTLSLHRHHHEHITDRQPQSHAVELDESMNWELQTLEGLACNMGCITCLTLTAHCFHHHSPRNVHDDNMKLISSSTFIIGRVPSNEIEQNVVGDTDG